MPLEVELVGIGGSSSTLIGDLDIGPTAERAVNAFYEAQRERHLHERQKLENKLGFISAPGKGDLQSRSAAVAKGDGAKWNRQELYLQDGCRQRAHMASRRYLAKHRNWLFGRAALDETALLEIIAMQHFVEVDLEDLLLPHAERRSEDAYGGADGNVSEQFLMDAARSTYVIDGERFSFADIMQETDINMEQDMEGVEKHRAVFIERLVSAVRQCLGSNPSPDLFRAVTTYLSQSGVASIDRSYTGPQIVVCGGDQTLQYDLHPSSCDNASVTVWDIDLLVRKFGFEMCVVCGYGLDENEDAGPITCSAKSFITKSCRIRFSNVDADNGGCSTPHVQAEVLNLAQETYIVDERGVPLVGMVKKRNANGFTARLLAIFGIVGAVSYRARRMCGSSRCSRICGRNSVCRNLLGATGQILRRVQACIGFGSRGKRSDAREAKL